MELLDVEVGLVHLQLYFKLDHDTNTLLRFCAGKIGISNNVHWFVPLDPNSKADREATERHRNFEV